MNREEAQASLSESLSRSDGDRVVELEGVVDRLEEFMDQQLERLEACLVADAPSEAELDIDEMMRERMAQLAEERGRWERERDEQVQQLQEECECLTLAWAQLEQEERNMLARESIAQLSSPSARGQGGQPGIRFVPVQETRGSDPPVVGTQANAAESQHEQAKSRSSVVRDFQQLSREMAKHSRKPNRPS